MTQNIFDHHQLLSQLRDPLHKEQGFRLLMSQYGKSLYWHIRRIVVGHDDAEDVVQETYIKIFRSIEDFRGDASQLISWIYRIATRESLQLLRRHTHFFQSIDSLSESLIETLRAENHVNGETAEMLFQEALLQLPTAQRIAFNLRYYDELSYEQIAEITGKKVGTLKTNYHYASERIKNYIKQHS